MQRVHDDVARFGWHVIGVNANGKAPTFSFSIGLFETFGHPELVVFGLPLENAHPLIGACLERIKQGASFIAGQVRTDILTNHRLAVLAVENSFYSAYLGSAIGYYGDTSFPALQLVWPDKQDHFPWEPTYDRAYVGSQVILNTATA